MDEKEESDRKEFRGKGEKSRERKREEIGIWEKERSDGKVELRKGM